MFKNEISNPIFQDEISNTEIDVHTNGLPWYKVISKAVAFPLPQVKKLYKDTIVPKKGSEEAAGYDLYAYIPEHTIEIRPGECKLIGTGVAITPPTGYCAFIMARSGLATKQGLRPANCVGLADHDYTGEYKVALYNDSNESRFIEVGDRIAQLVFMPYYTPEFEIVDELEETERADGGFGHTGTKG